MSGTNINNNNVTPIKKNLQIEIEDNNADGENKKRVGQ